MCNICIFDLPILADIGTDCSSVIAFLLSQANDADSRSSLWTGGFYPSGPDFGRRFLGFATSARPTLNLKVQRSGWRRRPYLKLPMTPSSACHARCAASHKHVVGHGCLCSLRDQGLTMSVCPAFSAVKRQ